MSDLFAVVVALLLMPTFATGCALDTSAVVPVGDPTVDSSTGDSGADAAVDSEVDGGPDAGGTDSSVGDGAVDGSMADGGLPDSGLVDSGLVDSGTVDSGTIDSGTIDSGAPDTGPGCIAVPETCDGTDEDCDGLIDNGTCTDCTRGTSGGSTYLWCDGTRRSFDDAARDCASRGYQLVVIESAAENAAVTALAAGGPDVWIGLSDAASEGTWVWVDGQVAQSGGVAMMYVNWRAGEPANGGGDNCVELDPGDGGRWNDVGCGGTKPILCEVASP